MYFDPDGKELFYQCLPRIDLLIIRLLRIDESILERSTRLKAIIKCGVGTDHIDVETATRLGIHVVISIGNHISVAESAILLMLALSRNLIKINKQTGGIRRELAVEMYGKKLGIVGYGRVGRHLQRIAEGLGMNILIYDPLISNQEWGELQFVELKELLGQSDYVSLHCPLNNDTFHMIGEEELASMKRSAFLINTARGAIVDKQALYRALKERRIAGAGLDVFEEEPLTADNPLLELDNVIATPHCLCQTHESLTRQMNSILDSAVKVYNGIIPDESVNKNSIDVLNDRIKDR
jgi:phosphoglycerate dehydrogenase-like enzyme